MPLITLCGLPSSGKTTIGNKLKDYLENKINKEGLNYKVEIYDDSKLGFSKKCYENQYEEKQLRGSLLACAGRVVNKDTILILDSNNYIKGFRYQLYCITRENSTNQCVVQLGLPAEKAIEWNKQRQDGYSDQVMTELINRFEEPISFNRWDSPLVLIIPTDEDFEEVFDQIFNSVVLKQALKPTLATVVKTISTTNHLYEVDKITGTICDDILKLQKEDSSSVIFLPGIKIPLDKKGKFLTIIQLKKQKRDFINYYKKQKLTIELDRVPIVFIEFLNNVFSA